MHTTIDLHRQAMSIARDTSRTLGETVAELMRRGLGQPQTAQVSRNERTGLPVVVKQLGEASRGFDPVLGCGAPDRLQQGDLTPAIRTERELAPTKRLYVALPPRRRSDALRRTADATFTIGDAKIRAAQLPDKIVLPNGVIIERPPYWLAGSARHIRSRSSFQR